MRHPKLPAPKTAHTGPGGPPLGPLVYVLVRHDGAMIAVSPTRHEAAGEKARRLDDVDEYEIVPVPVGAVPIGDLKFVPGV